MIPLDPIYALPSLTHAQPSTTPTHARPTLPTHAQPYPRPPYPTHVRPTLTHSHPTLPTPAQPYPLPPGPAQPYPPQPNPTHAHAPRAAHPTPHAHTSCPLHGPLESAPNRPQSISTGPIPLSGSFARPDHHHRHHHPRPTTCNYGHRRSPQQPRTASHHVAGTYVHLSIISNPLQSIITLRPPNPPKHCRKPKNRIEPRCGNVHPPILHVQLIISPPPFRLSRCFTRAVEPQTPNAT